MKNVEIKASKRESFGKKVKKLRAEGLLPIIVYGRKFQALSLQINLKDYIKKVEDSAAGYTSLIDLKVKEDNQTIPVITHQIQRDPLTGSIIHIDFRHIIMDEAIETKVPVETRGVPSGVKEDGGILIHGLREVVVKCLPGDIPGKFEVDVSSLKIGDTLHVSDLPKASNVEMVTSAEEMIASVAPPAKEEEAAPIPTPEEVVGAEAVAAGAAPAPAEAGKEKAPAGAPPPEAAPAGKPAKAAAGKEAKPSGKEEKK